MVQRPDRMCWTPEINRPRRVKSFVSCHKSVLVARFSGKRCLEVVCWWKRLHSILVALLGEKLYLVCWWFNIFVCRSHVCPRSGNIWHKGNAYLREYALRDTRYYEIKAWFQWLA